MTLAAWIALSLFVGVIVLHATLVWRLERRTADKQALLQTQLELLREAAALARYGAREEADALLEEAIAKGERAR